MKITTAFLILLFCGGILLAQMGPMDRGPRPMVPPTDELKAFLTLTDDQVQKLKDVQKAWRDAGQPIREQIAAKAAELRDALQQTTIDQTLVAKLKTEIADFQKEEQNLRAQYQPQALAILNDQQKAALTTLQKALDLMPAAHQAIFFNLLDSPQGTAEGMGLFGPRGKRGMGMMGGPMPPRDR